MNTNRIRRAALVACAAVAVQAAAALPAGASPGVSPLSQLSPPPAAAASPVVRAAGAGVQELDFDTRHKLHDAIIATDQAQEVWAVLLGSGLDVRALEDITRDEFLDEEGRADAKRRIAEVEEFFATNDGPELIRDLTATPQWKEAVTRGMIAADAPVGENVLLLVGAHKYLDGPDAPGERVSFQVNHDRSNGTNLAVLIFSGLLTWSGEGNRTYHLEGSLQANCAVIGRHTAWLQYGGSDESWKNSEETGCSDAGRAWRDITVTGTVAPNQRLELRLGTWQFASWKYSEAKSYAPAAAG
ncbi:hypothetical protein ACFVZ3_01840 [Kitasatospora purpeofusca]|uniref:hypothetical protein n=1 Tax=Kitasatospora purpeofusca TaxID=67352 RepID=UPI0036862F6B